MTTRTFLPHRRRGLATATVRDRIAKLDLTTREDGQTRLHDVTLDLIGPGQVAGLAPGTVTRRWPDPGSVDIVAGKVAYVEFGRDDLPWMLTPHGSALPWLTLVVLPEGEGVDFAPDREPLPVLTVAPGRLPDPGQTDLLAHVEAMAEGDDFARILSARRLEPGLTWRAALVPVFAGGVAAGLGKPTPSDPFAMAWDPVVKSILPVYDSWTFRTGVAPGFEDIAKSLRPAAVSRILTTLPMSDVTAQRLNLMNPGTQQILLRSALSTLDRPLPRLSDPPDLTFRETFRLQASRLRPVVDMPDAVVPPRYGHYHHAGAPKPWIDDLNHDMSLRLAAGYGAEIVRRRQDELTARSWGLAGPVEVANGMIQAAATGARAARRSHDILAAWAARDPAAVLPYLQTVAARCRGVDADLFARHPLAALATPQGRRATRPAARARVGAARPGGRSAAMDVARDNAAPFTPNGLPTIPTGQVGRRPGMAATDVGSAREMLERFRRIDDEPQPQPPRTASPEEAVGLGQAADAPDATVPQGPNVPNDDIAGLVTTLLAATEPMAAIGARINARIPATRDLQTLRIEPKLDLPLLEALADLAPAHVAPALETMRRDRLMLLSLDRPFCEALMVGANHELMRELTWRGYPGRNDMTPLRRIFPKQDLEGEPPVESDTPPIAAWTGQLGNHLDAPAASVLLMRTDLLRLFPSTAMFLWPARWEVAGGIERRVLDRPGRAQARFPVTRGALPPDATYLGYDLTTAQMRGPEPRDRGPAGWYLVFHGPDAMDAFGFDAPQTEGAAASLREWGDLSWSDVCADGDTDVLFLDRAALQVIRLDDRPQGDPPPDPPPPPIADPARLAGVMADRALTVAIHLSDLLEDGA